MIFQAVWVQQSVVTTNACEVVASWKLMSRNTEEKGVQYKRTQEYADVVLNFCKSSQMP